MIDALGQIDPDYAIVAGVLLIALGVPSLLAAFADRRLPLVAIVLCAIGGGLIWLVFREYPGIYDFAEIPHSFVRVVAQIVN
ncbi:hypothetical protein E2L08_05775 [Palleronia sediminis]|uniref:50S ribosomal protein L35 n=1 Tax=Palleronia sediminis TaxID=2547833 RepID=A0A4R6ACR6_9RHOB|nr:hypothetical protein [Palleronia sediminis]TDL81620.1 hypothetical protein E2L08_05775 [Palleronia sediminis]